MTYSNHFTRLFSFSFSFSHFILNCVSILNRREKKRVSQKCMCIEYTSRATVRPIWVTNESVKRRERDFFLTDIEWRNKRKRRHLYQRRRMNKRFFKNLYRIAYTFGTEWLHYFQSVQVVASNAQIIIQSLIISNYSLDTIQLLVFCHMHRQLHKKLFG